MRRMIRHAYRWIRRNLLHDLIRESRAERNLDSVIEVVGYFHLAAGLGEGARLCASQLSGRVRCVDCGPLLGRRHEVDWEQPAPPRTDAPAGLRLLHLNPPLMPLTILRLGLRNYRRCYNVAYWAWELPELSTEWRKALRYVNAVFVPSRFTRAAIMRHTEKPVIVVPHPVTLEEADLGVRELLGIPAEHFVVSTIFDLDSFGRKNPVAAVDAFRMAFADREDFWLVLKASHRGGHDAEIERLRERIHDAPRILLITDVWPKSRVAGLIASSDAYISLHRSEGFGLTLAEAILRGVPVVATGWSGNLDFCEPDSTYLVDARMVPVNDSNLEFRRMGGSFWAEPDIGLAARHLLTICTDREEARRRSGVARDRLLRFLRDNNYWTGLDELRRR